MLEVVALSSDFGGQDWCKDCCFGISICLFIEVGEDAFHPRSGPFGHLACAFSTRQWTVRDISQCYDDVWFQMIGVFGVVYWRDGLKSNGGENREAFGWVAFRCCDGRGAAGCEDDREVGWEAGEFVEWRRWCIGIARHYWWGGAFHCFFDDYVVLLWDSTCPRDSKGAMRRSRGEDKQSSMAVKTPGNVTWEGIASGLICGITPRDVTARKFGVSIASLPANASSPSLALEDPSQVVEVSLVKADGNEDPIEPWDEDIARAVEEKFALRLIWLNGDMYTGRVLV